jgi:enoyl-CoA hydratase/carnithine racemase
MTVHVSVADGVAEIVLDEPGRLNALDADGLRELGAAYADAERAGVRAVVLRGEGRAFCAGRDVSHVDPVTDDAAAYLDDLLVPLMHTISEFPAPTFAVATGACLGVGLGLLIATDIVYVGESARVGSPFANLGAALDSGGHALFFERLGAHRAMDLIVTGDLMTGTEAVAAGLFSRVLPDDEVLEFTRERARRAAAGPTAAFVSSKRLIGRLRDARTGFWESVAAESAVQTELSQTADYREGFAAFQEKRRPVFRGE